MQDIEIARNAKLKPIQEIARELDVRRGIHRILWKNKSEDTK